MSRTATEPPEPAFLPDIRGHSIDAIVGPLVRQTVMTYEHAFDATREG